ncbi:MAG TPA: hypothetical protein RMG45_28500, partial [Polyangiaceae bacterium LLY-WYZ-15_(1-7)]|nr:hypothetical protein [Polyangiaceae bacterium LLY-WYZ-15_(1-7)]
MSRDLSIDFVSCSGDLRKNFLALKAIFFIHSTHPGGPLVLHNTTSLSGDSPTWGPSGAMTHR